MRIFSLMILMITCTTAWAAEVTSASAIEQAAKRYLEQFQEAQEGRGRTLTFEIGSLDPRLRLAACERPLAFEFVSEPEKNTRNTLLVSCEGVRPWRLFLNVDIEMIAQAYVAATPLSRGTRITEDMLRLESVVINQERAGVYQQLEGLVGMEVRRPVKAGNLLTPSLLTAPEAVARGDLVKIEAKSGPVTIEARGIAVDSGRIGDQIAVENSRTGREVHGVIVAPGHIRVIM